MAQTILTDACGYVRMSSDKQAASPEQQRIEVERYAAEHGYRVVRWYEDLAISGDKTEKRAGFLEMRADAGKGDWKAILCWDQARLGRFDLFDAGRWLYPFRDAGITFETVLQGKKPWDAIIDQFMYLANQMGDAEHTRKTASGVVRAQCNLAEKGRYASGLAPFGMKMVGERFDKHLVVSEPEAGIVRELFNLYLEPAGTLRSVANAMNARGIPSPGSKGDKPTHWTKTTVNRMLTNRKYAGDFVYGKESRCQYSCMEHGPNKKVDARRSKSGAPVVKEGAAGNEVLIDRRTFDRVQAKLARQKGKAFKMPRDGQLPLLTGILHCAACSKPMIATMRKNRDGSLTRVYMCSTYHASGKSACNANTIVESKMVRSLIACIQGRYLTPEYIERIIEAMRQALDTKVDPAILANLDKRIAELDAELTQAVDNCLKIPKDLQDSLPELYRGVDKIRRQRQEAIDERNRLLAQPAAETGIDLREAAESLWSLRRVFDKCSPAVLREALQATIGRLDVWFVHEEHGKRMQSKYLTGEWIANPLASSIQCRSGSNPQPDWTQRFAITAAEYEAA